MGAQSESNEGLSGAIAIAGALINVNITGFAKSVGAALIENTGRGDVRDSTYRLGDVGGSGKFNFNVRGDQPPLPSNLGAFVGTLKVELRDDCYFQFSAAFTGVTFKHDKGEGDETDYWEGGGSWTKTGPLTMVWNGTTYTLSDEGYFSKEIHAGLSKNVDPIGGLTTSSTQNIDIVGVGNTDADENNAIDTTLGSYGDTPPIDGLKIRDVTLTRTDCRGVRIQIVRARNSHVDDLEGPLTYTVTDPDLLTSYASAAKFNGTPVTPAGMVERTSRASFVTDTDSLTVREYGLRSTKDDIEMPGNWTFTDPRGITSRGQRTTVYTTTDGEPADPAPPSGLKIVGSRIVEINRVRSQKEWTLDVNDSRDALIFPRTSITFDQFGMTNSASVAGVNGIYRYAVTNGGTGYTTAPTVTVTPTGGGSGAQAIALVSGGVVTEVLSVHPGSGYAAATVAFTGGGGTGAAATAVVANGTMPTRPTGLVPYDTQVLQVANGTILTIVRLDQWTREQEMASNLTYTQRRYGFPFVSQVGTLIPDSRDPDTIADALTPSVSAEANINSLEVRKWRPGIAIIIKRYVGSSIGPSVVAYVLEGTCTAKKQLTPYRIQDGNVQVYVARVIAIGGSWKHVTLAQRYEKNVRRQFTIFRTFTGSTIPDFPDQLETINDAPFLGLGTHTVMYTGTSEKVSVLESGDFPMNIGYAFDYEKLGQIKLDGWSDMVFTDGDVAVGWTNVDDLTNSGVTATALADGESDFDVFLD